MEGNVADISELAGIFTPDALPNDNLIEEPTQPGLPSSASAQVEQVKPLHIRMIDDGSDNQDCSPFNTELLP
ncbi:hypothetical protein DMENIID0001_030150 [Sergentomyia squamirostris]